MKISICIPSRAQVLGLWATICGCANALGDIEHEFIVAISGRKIDDDETRLIHEWNDSKVKVLHSDDVLSPTEARDLVAKQATGDFICFFDDHCIPALFWFHRVIFNDKDILHSSLSAAPGRPRMFHFVRYEKTLIAGEYKHHPAFSKTYRVLSAPAAGFAVKRSVWEDIGGYGDHFEGFGGEEAFINIKAQMLGYEVWLDPEMTYYHFYTTSGVRGYERVENRNNWTNGAYILGGQKWADGEGGSVYSPSEKIQKLRSEFEKRIVRSLDEVLNSVPAYQ